MELVFDRRGSGEPLVLLHGVGSRWQVFAPVLDTLAERHEVLALDMPGFGASPPLPAGAPATIAALTDAVAEWIGEMGLERPHVAGNSTGGGVALELASRGLARSATGLAPIGFWSSAERAFCQRSLRSAKAIGSRLRPALPLLFRPAASRALFFSQTFAHPTRVTPGEAVESVEALLDSASFESTLDAFTGYVAPADAADRVPVAIAWGTRDRLLLPRQARRARRLLPKARHVTLAGAGHVSMSDDPPAAAAAILETAAAASGV